MAWTQAFARPERALSLLLVQALAGCAALASCVRLACRARQLSDETAFQLGDACSLVFGPGTGLLNARVWAAQLLPALAPRPILADICHAQLCALVLLWTDVLLPERKPHAATHFASIIAKPSTLLPWLAALSQAVPFVPAGTEPGKSPPLQASHLHGAV